MALTLDDSRDALDDLDAALADAVDRYRVRNASSARWYEQAVDVLPGGNTRSALFFAPFPLCFERGERCWVFDIDGHRYLDAVGEFTAGLYGHSHPVIRAAIQRALDGGLNLAGHTAAEAELARALRERFPSMELVRFTNSGTEANLMALAAATAQTGKRSIVVFRGGYHGGVLTFATGRSPVNVPHRFSIAPYNDLEAAEDHIAEHVDDVAAILVEPMQGSAGCIPGDPDFLAGLRSLADTCGALLIFDEVMTSRLAPGGVQGRLGLRPDITTVGKYLGGGASFGAFGGRADVMSRFDPRRPDALPHAGTFNNNVISMAAGLAGLRDVYTPDEAHRLDARGDGLRSRLNGVFEAANVDMQCTGVGSLLNVHATAHSIRRVEDLADADVRRRDLLFFDLLERGVYIARRGFIALSLPFGDAEVDQLVSAVESVVASRRDLLGRRS